MREQLVGDAGLLEVNDVHVLAEHGAHGHDGIDRRALKKWRVDADDAGATVGVIDRHLPDDEPAPIVADEHGLLVTERIEEAREIAGQMRHVVGLDFGRARRAAIAALIGRDDVETCFGQGRNLEAPGIGELRKAVTENDRQAVLRSRLVDGHVDAVGLDDFGFRKGGHGFLRIRFVAQPGRPISPSISRRLGPSAGG